ncbi:hypothetical protein NL108_001971, partial [Boleophthalmus pectinirostris]
LFTLYSFAFFVGLVRAETPFDFRVHNNRVIGGSNAKPHVWKWQVWSKLNRRFYKFEYVLIFLVLQVSLQLDSNNDGSYFHICGGSLVDTFHVLTAAHCILSSNPQQYRAVVGEYNLDRFEGTEQFLRVHSIFVHPHWNGDLALGNDIAVLRLADSPYDNGYIGIANLPYSGDTLPNGFECFITGWGLTDFAGSIPDILQEAPILVVEHSVCSQPDWWGSLVLETMVCAGGDGLISGCQ